MKKTAVWILATAFVSVALIGGLVNAEEKLERIPSPDQIKNFKVMKKENGVLFGVRLQNQDMRAMSEKASSTIKSGNAVLSDKAMSEKNEKLEKIATPQMIALYEKIRKVGTALWGVKKNGSHGDQVQKSEKSTVPMTAEMTSCVAAAIDVKDAALTSAIAEMSSSLQAAISERNVCQKAALGSIENHRSENEICVKSFQEKNKELSRQNREAHQQAWTGYKTSLQLCRPVSVTEGEVMVQDGSEKMMETVTEMMVE